MGVATVAVALAVAATARADTEPTEAQPQRIATTRTSQTVEITLANGHTAPHGRHHSGTQAQHR